MALTNLTNNSSNQVLVAKLGGLTPLIALASNQNESSRYAAMALANLAANRQNRAAVVTLGGLKPLNMMIHSGKIDIQRAAALALYNLSCNSANHIAMIKAEIVTGIAVLGKVLDLECKRYAIMTLANLAANVETRAAATRSGGLQTAVLLVKDDDVDSKRYACIALCNMANNSVIQEQIIVHGALPFILQLIDDNISDVDSQKQVLLALINVAANEVNHSTMIQNNLLRILLLAFESPNIDCKEYAAFCIANLCSNPDYLQYLGKNGGIPPLLLLSQSKNVHSQCIALAALRRLADCSSNWALLIEAGVLNSLTRGGLSLENEILKEVSACICSLSLSEEHRVEIAYKCISAVVSLSSSPILDIQTGSWSYG